MKRPTVKAGTWVAIILAATGLFALFSVLARGLPAVPGVLRGDWDVVLTTLGLVSVGLTLSLLIGGGLALLTWLARLPTAADLLISVAYLIPPFIGATAWLAALGPGNVFTGRAILSVYSPFGIELAWVTHYAPLAYLLIRAALSAQGEGPLLAARVHGLSSAQGLRWVVLPLIWPGVGAAAVLIGLSLLGNFGVPAVLGFPAKIYTLSTLAYARLLNPTLADPLSAASGVAWLLVVAALPALLIRPRAPAGDPASDFGLPTPRRLRRMAWAAVSLWTLIALALPLAATLLLAFKPAYRPGFTLENFAGALALDSVRRGLWHSVWLALAAAAICALLGLWIARAGQGSRLAGAAQRLLTLPYLLPGTLLALGLILTFGRTALYATPLFLMLAYLLRFLAPGVEGGRSAATPGTANLEFAARLHRVRRWQTFWRVTLPLARPHLVASFLVIYPLALSEVTLSALLYAPGAETAGVGVLNLLSEGNLRGAAALATVLLLLSLPTLLVPRGRA
ncbi:ABC transporter permease [Deinococcus marmoris]|uniref:ABC transport system permease protein n=1 Tax=Deinococcus marmoris TaxID=249408 RepID=A0A1U7NRZ2_9DEIO|nr:ABC transporter permease subunit [Deinococcus marmoris]OLV15677.1 ABC transport system permease protein [Deinococcus marmoris]